jgi:V/A-type H+-transporting ATPase subunit F
MEGKVAVLGSADFVMPFAALGLDTFAAGEGRDELIENAERIVGAGYALVVIAENIAPAVEQVFCEQQKSPTPCIIVVPFTTKSQGFATSSLAEALKMATGIDILQNN